MQQPDKGDSLFPPRDKKARQLWHELNKFKKAVTKGAKSNTLELPPSSSYMRACAHNFAERLGMRTETREDGQQKGVNVHFELPLASGAATGSKRKEPGETSGALCDTEMASSAPTSATASEPPPAKQQKKQYVSRLSRCVPSGDATGATAIFRELVAAGQPCTPDMWFAAAPSLALPCPRPYRRTHAHAASLPRSVHIAPCCLTSLTSTSPHALLCCSVPSSCTSIRRIPRRCSLKQQKSSRLCAQRV